MFTGQFCYMIHIQLMVALADSFKILTGFRLYSEVELLFFTIGS